MAVLGLVSILLLMKKWVSIRSILKRCWGWNLTRKKHICSVLERMES